MQAVMSRGLPSGVVGIAALRKILAPAPFDVAELKGKTVAVDADNLVWSFVTALAGAGQLPTAPDGRSNAHLLGLVSRLSLYAKWGAKSIWVFDGVQPDLKEATLIERGQRIEAARVAGDNYQASVAVDEDDLEECRTLLTALGLPWIVAPGESDAQCAQLVQSGKAWAAVTQDWDIALFGSPRALRNLTLSETRKPEMLDLEATLATAGLTREQLVDAAILIGTDYNAGVEGVGPVKAIKAVKQGRRPEDFGIENADEVRALYFEHPVDTKFEPRFAKADAKATLAFLAKRGIDEKRGQDLLQALEG
jgi:flap endonuclease-1